MLSFGKPYPCIERIERTVNAWGNTRVVVAVEAVGRNDLIITTIPNRSVLSFLAMAALTDGYMSLL